LLITLLISCYNAYCQEEAGNGKWLEYIEELAEETEENTESIEKLFNDLSYLSENPCNLNSITAEQLRQLPFLSDLQILNILDYQRKNNGFATIYELKNIRFLDMETIELILPFVYVGEIDRSKSFSLKNLSRYGKNELMLRYDRGLDEKAGYKDLPDSILQQYPNRKYVGEAFYHSLRYSYTFDNRLQAGFVAEKDAGEAFWNKTNKGYDYYSAHIFLKDIGIIRSLAVGDYKVSFGQGLVASNDFTAFRGSMLTQIERRNNGFRRHYSTNENDFFRGVASTVNLNRFDISAFYSNRKADATVNDDVISTLKTDGIHRTPGDLEKKRNIEIQTVGGNIRYVGNEIVVGITALTYSFGGLSVDPALAPYNRFYFRGKRNSNFGADYKMRHGNIVVFGETAISQNGAAATINALQWSASSGIKAIILYRNFGRSYQALYGNAFSQNSTVQNEEGLYISMQCTPFAYWKLSGYVDFFSFPWLKYGVDAPSSGKEYTIQGDFTGFRNSTITARYRYRQRESTAIAGHEAVILPTDQHRLRLQFVHKPSKTTSFRTLIEGNISDNSMSSASRGLIISQNAGWNNTESPFQADIYAAYFNTDNYDSRIYSNEKNMLYSFSIPSFYGEGLRMTTVLRYNITNSLYVSVKAAWTHYYDRETTGSGTEEIEGRNKTDLYAQIRWKF
jgi:hypothetical protein